MSGQGQAEERTTVMIRDFTDLLIWQKAIVAGQSVYELTKHFPSDERFGLTAQIRRAAVSISSSIAEGHARQGKEFPHFLSIAEGSLAETESQLLFAKTIGYLREDDVAAYRALASEIHRMGTSLIEKLRA
jgi:four helix bundle protein